jgi:hypothetical protein
LSRSDQNRAAADAGTGEAHAATIAKTIGALRVRERSLRVSLLSAGRIDRGGVERRTPEKTLYSIYSKRKRPAVTTGTVSALSWVDRTGRGEPLSERAPRDGSVNHGTIGVRGSAIS